MTPDQTDAFSQDEGDNWFRRNEAALAMPRHDHATEMVLRWNDHEPIGSVCELGCANGWRLAALASSLPAAERLVGSDLSAAAIEDGRSRWPNLDLRVGSLDHPGFDETFDVVIVSFVLTWVARPRLAASIAGIDALVRPGGALVLADFLPDAPCARPYHHRTDVEIYTFKQDYTACFTDLGTYAEVEREVFSHDGATSVDIDPQDRAMCALLRKST